MSGKVDQLSALLTGRWFVIDDGVACVAAVVSSEDDSTYAMVAFRRNGEGAIEFIHDDLETVKYFATQNEARQALDEERKEAA